jgi:transposase-like protein
MGDTGAMINLQSLMDDAKCFATVRDMRWPDGVMCPHCESPEITKQGRDETQPERQRYQCKFCKRRFDDLTDTIFASHHQPLRIWILCLYLMGLNLSNAQLAQELDLNKDDVHQMTTQLRQGIVTQKPASTLSGEVECDEVYIVAGHKGQPDEVSKKGVSAGAVDSKGRGDAGRSKARHHRSSA